MVFTWLAWSCFEPGDVLDEEADPVARKAHEPRPSDISEWGRLECTKSLVGAVTELGADGSADKVLEGLSSECQGYMAKWQEDHLREQYEIRDRR